MPRHFRKLLGLGLAACVFSSLALAQEDGSVMPVPEQQDLETAPPAMPAPEVSVAATPMIDGPGLETYIDGLMAGLMQENHVAGAAISIVYQGQVLLAKGYGAASFAPPKPVKADQTLFRIGSVSKTFSYIALMQLIDQGKLSLDTPVNDVLPEKLRVPDDGYEEPILIRHLMTHTAGFEDTALGHLFYDAPEKAPRLEDYLAARRPHRVRPPGVAASYSNYSLGLAGAIIAHVSGLGFEDYIERRILQPLRMSHTSFREPLGTNRPESLAPALAADISNGFVYRNGGYEKGPFEYISGIGPAGAASATAADMARYMMAYLNFGELDGARILPEARAREMRQVLFRNAEGVSGLAHGYLEYQYGDYHGLGHAGGTVNFLTEMAMIPDLGLGMFISVNTAGGEALPGLALREIMEYYFPEARPGPAPAPPADFLSRAGKLTGVYMTTRRGYSGLEKLILGVMGASQVAVTPDGYLLTVSGGRTTRWVEERPLYFAEVGGSRKLAFLTDADGDVTGYADGRGVMVYEKIGFLASPNGLALVLGLTLVAALGTVIGGWLRRHDSIARLSGATVAAGRLMPVVGFSWLAFLGCFALGMTGLAAMGNAAIYVYPTPMVKAALWLGVVTAVLTLASAFTLWPAFKATRWPVWRRIRHAAAVLIFLLALALLYYWRAIGLSY